MIINRFLDAYWKELSLKALSPKIPHKLITFLYITCIVVLFLFLHGRNSFFIGMFFLSILYVLIAIIWFDKTARGYGYSFLKLMKGVPNPLIKKQFKEVRKYLKANKLNKPKVIEELISLISIKVHVKKANWGLISIVGAFVIFVLTVLVTFLEPPLKINRELFLVGLMALGLVVFVLLLVCPLYKMVANRKYYEYRHIIYILKEIKIRELK